MRERERLLKRPLHRWEELVRDGLSPEDARKKATNEANARQQSYKKRKSSSQATKESLEATGAYTKDSLEAATKRVKPTEAEAKIQLDKSLTKEQQQFPPDSIKSYMIGLSGKLEYSSNFYSCFGSWTAVGRLMYNTFENTIYVNGTEWEVSQKTTGKSKTRAKSVVEKGVPGESDHYWKIQRKGWGANRYFRLKQSSRTNIDDQAMLTKLMKKIQEVLGCQMS